MSTTPTTSYVRARINENIKNQAAEVLEEMGLTTSDAVRILLTRIAKTKTFPLELIPNLLTQETLEKSAQGEDIHRAKDLTDLYKQLEI